MSVHFILDGYNIIKSDPTGTLPAGSLEQQRARLIGLIQKNNPQGSPKNEVTVVFDGTYENAFWGDTPATGIRVLFSAGESADKKIESLVLASSNSSTIIVVTDDKGIKKMIAHTNARVLPLKYFYTKLFDKIHIAQKVNAQEMSPEATNKINDEFMKKWLK